MLNRSFVIVCVAAAAAGAQSTDTLRLDVGAQDVDGRIYAPHAARVRVWVGGTHAGESGGGRMRAEWINALTHGDSAGRAVHRWITTGTQYLENGNVVRWELRQTYDARTLQPYGIARTASTGAASSFRIDGRDVTGFRKSGPDAAPQDVKFTIDRPGFVASASDLVPLAAGLSAGKVMVAPVWGPNMTASEMRVFSVIGKTDVDVEGTKVNAWKVEERRQSDRVLLATWWLIEQSPYMVYGEVPLPDGSIQRMTEVAVPMPKP